MAFERRYRSAAASVGRAAARRASSSIVGMFAFALLGCGARGRLLLARDRLGIKPLYYRLLPDGIAFASELKALLLLGKPPIDRSAVRDYLFHGYVPAPKSIYQGIAKLPAGHTLTWEDGRVQHRALLAPVDRDRVARTAEETLRAARRAAARGGARHNLSDVPVGRVFERRHRFRADRLLPEAAAHLHAGIRARGRSELGAARAVARPSEYRAHRDDRAGGGFCAGARSDPRRCSTSPSATAPPGRTI